MRRVQPSERAAVSVEAKKKASFVEQACVGMETSSTSLAVESSQPGALHTTW